MLLEHPNNEALNDLLRCDAADGLQRCFSLQFEDACRLARKTGGETWNIRAYRTWRWFPNEEIQSSMLFLYQVSTASTIQYTHILLDIDCWQATDRLKANPKIPTGDRLSHPHLKLFVTVEHCDLAFATRCCQDVSFFLAEVQNQACRPSSWGVPAHDGRQPQNHVFEKWCSCEEKTSSGHFGLLWSYYRQLLFRQFLCLTLQGEEGWDWMGLMIWHPIHWPSPACPSWTICDLRRMRCNTKQTGSPVMGKKEKKSSSVLDLKKSARPEGLARFVWVLKCADGNWTFRIVFW